MKKGVSFVLLRITVNKLVITASKTSGGISPISPIMEIQYSYSPTVKRLICFHNGYFWFEQSVTYNIFSA
jgi:hypothetical protein